MLLENIIKEIEKLEGMNREERGEAIKAIENSIVFPDNFRDPVAEIINNDHLGFYLRLHAFLVLSREKALPLLTALLAESRKKNFEKGFFKIETKVTWSPDNFLKEINHGDITQLEIRGSFYEKNPNQTRIGPQEKSHQIEATLRDRVLEISASKDFKSLLPKIIKEIEPQTADIRISSADAQLLLENTNGLQKMLFEQLLKPKKRQILEISMRSIALKEQKVIEITVPISYIPDISKTIGKELLGIKDGNRSFILSLKKQYFLQKSILPDLQKIISVISEFKPSATIGQFLISKDQVKFLLEKEIEYIRKSYSEFDSLGSNTHMFRGGLVKRLAVDQFGEEINKPFDKLEPEQYLAFLREKGFDYNGELDEADEPPYIFKERCLLAFVKQVYLKNPVRLLNGFRNWYKNEPPKIKILSKTEIDALRVSKLHLPSCAILIGLSLKGDTDGISFSLSYGEEKDYQLYMYFSGKAPLIDLQEMACNTLGIIVK